MALSFIGLSGRELFPHAAEPAKKKSGRAAPESFHRGWVVTGFSPEMLAEAEGKNEVESAGLVAFDQADWMRKNAPESVKSQGKSSTKFSIKTFELEQAAEQCAELLRRAGWKAVRVVAKAKGGK